MTLYENGLRLNVTFISYSPLKIANVNKKDLKTYFIYEDEY